MLSLSALYRLLWHVMVVVKKKRIKDVKWYYFDALAYHNKYINLCRVGDLENDIIHFNPDICVTAYLCSLHTLTYVLSLVWHINEWNFIYMWECAIYGRVLAVTVPLCTYLFEKANIYTVSRLFTTRI